MFKRRDGGKTRRSILAYLLDVASPKKLLQSAFRLGPGHQDEKIACAKSLVPAYFALGMTSYAPNIAFYVIFRRYLIAHLPELVEHLDSFETHKTRKQHDAGIPYKGSDEQMEEIIKMVLNSTPSNTEEGFEMGNSCQEWYFPLRTWLLSLVGIKEAAEARQRPFHELDEYVVRFVQYLNHGAPASRRREDAPLMSYCGTVERDASHGVDALLSAGRERAAAWVNMEIVQDNSKATVSDSLLPPFFAAKKKKAD